MYNNGSEIAWLQCARRVMSQELNDLLPGECEAQLDTLSVNGMNERVCFWRALTLGLTCAVDQR